MHSFFLNALGSLQNKSETSGCVTWSPQVPGDYIALMSVYINVLLTLPLYSRSKKTLSVFFFFPSFSFWVDATWVLTRPDFTSRIRCLCKLEITTDEALITRLEWILWWSHGARKKNEKIKKRGKQTCGFCISLFVCKACIKWNGRTSARPHQKLLPRLRIADIVYRYSYITIVNMDALYAGGPELDLLGGQELQSV